jgi:hypothetical protein
VWLCHGIRRGVGGATGLSAVVATVLLSGTPLLSRETVAEVPFELYQHHLIVTKGSIGPLNGLSLLIDTGTIPSMVDVRIARKLHLQAEPSMLVAFGQTVEIESTMLNGFRIGVLQTGARHDVLLCRVDRPGEGFHPIRHPGPARLERGARARGSAEGRSAAEAGVG